MHGGDGARRSLSRHLVHHRNDPLHRLRKLYPGIRLDPPLKRVRGAGVPVDMLADFQIDPETRQQGRQHHFKGLEGGDAEQIADIMIAHRRGLGRGEGIGADAKVPEVLLMERALDENCRLRGGGKLDDVLGAVSFTGGQG